MYFIFEYVLCIYVYTCVWVYILSVYVCVGLLYVCTRVRICNCLFVCLVYVGWLESGWWFLTLLLVHMMCMRYLMASISISPNAWGWCLATLILRKSLFFQSFFLCLACISPRTYGVIVIAKATFHPLFHIFVIVCCIWFFVWNGIWRKFVIVVCEFNELDGGMGVGLWGWYSVY